MRMPPSVSLSRPVISALILPRSRNSGRSFLNAYRHHAAEGGERDERHDGQEPVEIEEIRERDERGDDAPRELDETGADEISNPFGVGHDARDEDAGLRRVEVPHRQTGDVRLDPAPHVGDRALRGDAKHLGEREGRQRLHERRRAGRKGQWQQQIRPAVPDHVVDQEFRAGRQDEPATSG